MKNRFISNVRTACEIELNCINLNWTLSSIWTPLTGCRIQDAVRPPDDPLTLRALRESHVWGWWKLSLSAVTSPCWPVEKTDRAPDHHDVRRCNISLKENEIYFTVNLQTTNGETFAASGDSLLAPNLKCPFHTSLTSGRQMWNFDPLWTPCGSSSPFINKSWHIYCASNGCVQALGAQHSTQWDQIPPIQPICGQKRSSGQDFTFFAWIDYNVSHVHGTLKLCTIGRTSIFYIHTYIVHILEAQRKHYCQQCFHISISWQQHSSRMSELLCWFLSSSTTPIQTETSHLI